MSETNIQTNSALISLSRAAQLTGYHQDYLGQLCRLGKLPATKVGRNWFTFPEAVNRLTSPAVSNIDLPVEEILSELENETESEQFVATEPKVIQNITVSQVEGLPIAIRSIPTPVRSVNSVQNILTTLRIESLQREVSELRQMLARLMTEVANHTSILESRAQNRASAQQQDLLRHSYISNFDFNAPFSRRNIMLQEEPSQPEKAPLLNLSELEPRYSWVAILSAAAVIAAFAMLTYTSISGQFFGSGQPQVSTVYHHMPTIATELQPTVAGDTISPESFGISQ
ncbi:MAG TPA: hypothetical protein VHQ41_00765 [Patescibacteria group bacterium]|nr:hypothetical protein [Patescibacteria group bacterium]